MEFEAFPQSERNILHGKADAKMISLGALISATFVGLISFVVSLLFGSLSDCSTAGGRGTNPNGSEEDGECP